MADACPVVAPGDPLVQGLLSSTDCHVQLLVRSGYGELFEGAGGAFGGLLTALLTIYVGVLGYRLLLGRGQLNISDVALTAVKLGAVVALATQWGTYQTVVYRLLFDGPQELADGLLRNLAGHGAAFHGDVFAGLQRAFDDLTAFSPATPPGTPAQAPSALAQGVGGSGVMAPAAAANNVSTLLSKAGFDSVLLLGSAVVLLLCSLGVLLAAKIVLGLLLALGPMFIALLLFESTRGLFEGWLRASLGFAFAPLAVTMLLGLALTLLEPSLAEIETMRDSGTYTPGVAFSVTVLVMVFAGVSLGMMVAAGVIARGFKLPRLASPAASGASRSVQSLSSEAAAPGRAARVAAAAVAQERRDATTFARTAMTANADGERRTSITVSAPRVRVEQAAVETRLGQEPRRRAQPRTGRSGVRSTSGSGG